jgi:hypothetical protein
MPSGEVVVISDLVLVFVPRFIRWIGLIHARVVRSFVKVRNCSLMIPLPEDDTSPVWGWNLLTEKNKFHSKKILFLGEKL